MTERQRSKLAKWQARYGQALAQYGTELEKMEHRESRYRGEPIILGPDGKPAKKQATHVRNVTMEIIETQIDSTIPHPKVEAVHEEDEPLAKLIEDYIRDEQKRLKVEELNDESERTCPIQGAVGFLAGWDVTKGTHTRLGEFTLTQEHPKRIIPQDGVYVTDDMDWFFVRTPVTKRWVKRTYGKDVSTESEEAPEAKSLDEAVAEEIVTMITAYYVNEEGGIGRYIWVGNTELEDLDDYQTRRIYICKKCGTVGDGIKCRSCGGKSFQEEKQEEIMLTDNITTENGTVIPAESQKRDEFGQPVFRETQEAVQVMNTGGGLLDQMAMPPPMTLRTEPVMGPTKIPYYKPRVYPLVLRKNISQFGRFLGGSDVDAIESQQNEMNKESTKVSQKTLGGGSFTAIPKGLKFKVDDEDNKVVEVNGASDMEAIKTYNLQVDTSSDRRQLADMYEEARQTIGITDSLQGRRDATATSKIAKEFSARQAEGRMESKRVMKRAAWRQIFELMFKFWLAYADEPRSVRTRDESGKVVFRTITKWDFLKQDAAGEWYWNDEFIFSCDDTAPLAGNREAMWQEARLNFQSGAYGPPTELESLLHFWTVMEENHYPTAKESKALIEERIQKRDAMQQQMETPDALGGGTAPPMDNLTM